MVSLYGTHVTVLTYSDSCLVQGAVVAITEATAAAAVVVVVVVVAAVVVLVMVVVVAAAAAAAVVGLGVAMAVLVFGGWRG